jgi:hypothetical protein
MKDSMRPLRACKHAIITLKGSHSCRPVQPRGPAPIVVPPVSLMLATWSQDYINGLTATRYRGEASSQEALEGLDSWIAGSRPRRHGPSPTRRATSSAWPRCTSRGAKRMGGRAPTQRPTGSSEHCQAHPSAPSKAPPPSSGRSEQAVSTAIPRLLATGVLKQTTTGRRYRAFEAVDLLDMFESYAGGA